MWVLKDYIIKFCCKFSEHSADVNATNSEGSTALFDAVKRNNKEITNVLLSYGARTDVTLAQG